MKFLLTIKDKTSNSKDVLDIGCKIAEGFSADLAICYVGKKSKAIMDNDVKLARKSLSDWNIYHPGLEVLEWAFNLLKTKGFARNLEFNVDNLKEVNDQVRMVIPTNSNYKIRLCWW